MADTVIKPVFMLKGMLTQDPLRRKVAIAGIAIDQ